MKKLLKIYGLNSDMGYYELIVNSFLRGQFSQAYEQFRAMPKQNRIDFLKSATVGGWDSGLGNHKLLQLFDNVLK
jgi:hypothetical protein